MAAAPHSLRLASLSLDDIYSNRASLVSLAEQHPHNKLVHGRGQPGTHDLQLGTSCLAALKRANEPAERDTKIRLPIFDKSRFDGQGDRSDEVVIAEGPLDVVVFEGWMAGFGPLSEEELHRRYQEAKADPRAYGKQHLDYEQPFFLAHEEEHLAFVNRQLRQYHDTVWSYLDCFVQLKPVEMNYVWEWRLQVRSLGFC